MTNGTPEGAQGDLFKSPSLKSPLVCVKGQLTLWIKNLLFPSLSPLLWCQLLSTGGNLCRHVSCCHGTRFSCSVWAWNISTMSLTRNCGPVTWENPSECLHEGTIFKTITTQRDLNCVYSWNNRLVTGQGVNISDFSSVSALSCHLTHREKFFLCSDTERK